MSNSELQHAILREVGASESIALEAWVDAQNEEAVMPRPPAEYRASAERHWLLAVVDDTDAYMAVSGVFATPVPPDPDDDLEAARSYTPAYAEFGSTLVGEAWRGYGLQPLLVAARAASYLVDATEDSLLTLPRLTAVKPGNDVSYVNVVRGGFRCTSTPPDAAFEPCPDDCKPNPDSGRRCCCDFLGLPAVGFGRALRTWVERFDVGNEDPESGLFPPPMLELSRKTKGKEKGPAAPTIRLQLDLPAARDPDRVELARIFANKLAPRDDES